MKVGLILECGPQGADKAVCEHLIGMLVPGATVESLTLDNKPKLITGCGGAAARLLASGCERVIVVWDLYPAWREAKARPCRKEDRERILTSLANAGVAHGDVCLVCIEEELEAWLLADGRALEAVLSRPTRAARVPIIKNPERERNPKARLDEIFRTFGGRPYSDRVHAIQIVRNLGSVNVLARRCQTFRRFALKIDPNFNF